MKKIFIILLILIITFITACKTDDQPIGGQRDEHGCLGPAGYSWNETEKECVKSWETGVDRYQVNDYNTCVESGYVTTTKTIPAECETPSGKKFVELVDYK